MYVVFEDGSRQYRVSEGDLVKVDYRDAEIGQRIEFANVLLHAHGTELQIGKPSLTGYRVVAEVVDHPSTKTMIQYFRRRKNYRRLKGHRQHFTQVKVVHILAAGQDAPPASKPTPTPETPAAPTA